MKLLPNINKSVPEAADPALIKPVSDALEALDAALGAAPSTLTTTAKTLVGAINEIDGDVLKLRPWAVNTNANTLGTGIYQITQATTPETFNYPVGYGILLSFVTPIFVFQMFARNNVPIVLIRTRSETLTWSLWKELTST